MLNIPSLCSQLYAMLFAAAPRCILIWISFHRRFPYFPSSGLLWNTLHNDAMLCNWGVIFLLAAFIQTKLLQFAWTHFSKSHTLELKLSIIAKTVVTSTILDFPCAISFLGTFPPIPLPPLLLHAVQMSLTLPELGPPRQASILQLPTSVPPHPGNIFPFLPCSAETWM